MGRERAAAASRLCASTFRKSSVERGEAKPTLTVGAFAKANFVLIGYLFLSKPPLEQISIPRAFYMRKARQNWPVAARANPLDNIFRLTNRLV